MLIFDRWHWIECTFEVYENVFIFAGWVTFLFTFGLQIGPSVSPTVATSQWGPRTPWKKQIFLDAMLWIVQKLLFWHFILKWLVYLCFLVILNTTLTTIGAYLSFDLLSEQTQRRAVGRMEQPILCALGLGQTGGLLGLHFYRDEESLADWMLCLIPVIPQCLWALALRKGVEGERARA